MWFNGPLFERFRCKFKIFVSNHKFWTHRRSFPSVQQQSRPSICQIELLEDRTVLSAAFPEFVDPNPSADNGFGNSIVALNNGNVVITAPFDDAGGTDAGAVYLFDGTTGSLISTLTGSSNYDLVGNAGVTALTNGNFVVSSSQWNNGSASYAGAVTFGDGLTGVSGVVSATNSLVGASSSDQLGFNSNGNYPSSVTPLANGNYVVTSPQWDNGSIADAGAVTFGNGNTGVVGEISSTNSLVGSHSFDQVGSPVYDDNLSEYISAVTELSNGNYVVTSTYWSDGVEYGLGAVTFGNGTTGISGIVSSSNSLVGTSSSDQLGSAGVTALSNGNYVVSSPNWTNGSLYGAGAVTFGNGTSGVSGNISASNSLIGSSDYDQVGNAGVIALPNGNYVVCSSYWNNGSVHYAGAVTFGNGLTGISGVISSSNSLVGSSDSDEVGAQHYSDYDEGYVSSVTVLSNGNYVISNPNWDNGSVYDAGAVTFGNASTGVTGTISSANSLVGSSDGDKVGTFGVVPLTNGNYVISSPYWTNGSIYGAGAVTFGNGTTGIMGTISSSNSLVGSSNSDYVGLNSYDERPQVTALTNGNYVVSSPEWNNGIDEDAGAVTFGDGNSGVTGAISSANSLVGSNDYDRVGNGGITALKNGNYVVSSYEWSNGIKSSAGAVTFGDGTSGINGVVSAANSLVGTTDYDNVGRPLYNGDQYVSSITALANGNYVVSSPEWNNGFDVDAGAVTFGNGATGISGTISSTNSLVGTTDYDQVGIAGVSALLNGNYVVSSPYWNNGTIVNAGAVTFGSGTTGINGMVSETNSLAGSTYNDAVGRVIYDEIIDQYVSSVTTLYNGNYVVRSPTWDDGTTANAGAVTYGNGTTGVSGEITSSNSRTGLAWNIISPYIVTHDLNNTFYSVFLSDGKVWVDSQGDGYPDLTFDPLSDMTVFENASEQTVNLTGIAAGGFGGNPVSITATSNNQSLIPDPIISYASPNSTGSLQFTPLPDQTGLATITVTVEDGGLDKNLATTFDNNILERTFDITVSTLLEIELRVVETPTSLDSDGAAAILPDHQSVVEEWSSFLLEIWVTTESTSSQGIFTTGLDLQYETEIISATMIEYGPGFALNQSGSINDTLGAVENLYAETTGEGLGIGDYLLFARIQFDSLTDDGVDLDLDGQSIGPYDLGFSVESPEVTVVGDNLTTTQVNTATSTNIYANPYDLNDDDAINFRDLILFASTYGEITSESSSVYAWFSDLNQSNKVEFKDLLYFASNYNKSKAEQHEIVYPNNFPTAWNPPLQVSTLSQIENTTPSLKQIQTDVKLLSAVQDVSSDIARIEQQQLEDIKIVGGGPGETTLGRVTANTIYIDVNGAGSGWSVDATPLDYSEDQYESQLSLIAISSGEAEDLIDLRTVNRLQLDHLQGNDQAASGVIEDTLALGIPRLSEWDEATDDFFVSFEEASELLSF